MKNNLNIMVVIALVMIAVFLGGGVGTRAQSSPEAMNAVGTMFAYQGYLQENGAPADGIFDFQFQLFTAATAGSQIGSTISLDNIPVTKGLFVVQLDFGVSAFTGNPRYLQIGVRPGVETGVYDVFSSRQLLTPVPYAIFSSSTTWSGVQGIPADIADGDQDTTYTAGTGLLLNNNQFGVNSVTVQSRITGICAEGSAIRQVSDTGTVTCETDDNTTYTAGTGLVLSGSQFSVSDTVVQFRVSGSCPEGSAIRQINADGTVTCQTASGGGAHTHWGEIWSGSGVGLSLNSTDDYPDLFLDGAYGYIRSPNAMRFYTDNGGIRLDANQVSSASIDLWAGNNIDLDTGNDISISAGDMLDIEAIDDVTLDADESITIELGEVNSKDDYLDIYRHDIGVSSKHMLRLDESANLWIAGNFSANGTKSAVVDTQSYGQRKLYAVESPENWFEDFGSGKLQAGTAVVAVDPMFAETVNLTKDYYVYLTPLGDCALYVAEKTKTTFTVRAMSGQTCSIAFDYRIIARRLGYEDVRMEPVQPAPDSEGADHEPR